MESLRQRCLDPDPDSDPVFRRGWIRIRVFLRGWIRIRIRSISDRIRNPAPRIASWTWGFLGKLHFHSKYHLHFFSPCVRKQYGIEKQSWRHRQSQTRWWCPRLRRRRGLCPASRQMCPRLCRLCPGLCGLCPGLKQNHPPPNHHPLKSQLQKKC